MIYNLGWRDDDCSGQTGSVFEVGGKKGITGILIIQLEGLTLNLNGMCNRGPAPCEPGLASEVPVSGSLPSNVAVISHSLALRLSEMIFNKIYNSSNLFGLS